MEQKLHLIPYQVNEVVEVVEVVPKGIELIAVPKIWENSKGKGITVAILDTGCDVTHPDLSGRIIGVRNFTSDDDGQPDVVTDYSGHGTHVAGTIAAIHNGTGVVGVAPEANLLILKVLDQSGSGKYDWILNGINYAVEQRVDIISMSLGGSVDVPELHQAIQNAISNQILVVCAAGNEGDGQSSSDEFAYPASYNEVISVGSINLQRGSSEFSNSNNEVDLVAPGEEILSTYLNGTYAKLSGTSMATPHVSGALALIKEIENRNFERNLTEAELYAQLIKRTIPLGNSPKLDGNGMLYLTTEEFLSDVFNQRLSAQALKI
ncbi:S8 family peptidase [Ureibacillus composti]